MYAECGRGSLWPSLKSGSRQGLSGAIPGTDGELGLRHHLRDYVAMGTRPSCHQESQCRTGEEEEREGVSIILRSREIYIIEELILQAGLGCPKRSINFHNKPRYLGK